MEKCGEVNMREIRILRDKSELDREAAEIFVRLADQAVAGRFSVALAGGSTPRGFYRLLAGEYRHRVDWAEVFFFFGDERWVPVDHPDSNYRMAKENLFDPLDIRSQNIFRWQTEKDVPPEAAASYENGIREFFVPNGPCLDLAVLGVGTDGHTASLFPYSPALKNNTDLAISDRVEKLNAYRLTMTYPMLNAAKSILFLASGEDKNAVLRDVLEGEFLPDKYPVQGIAPKNGRVLWLLDKPAASLLTK